jgi:hypothetical protein
MTRNERLAEAVKRVEEGIAYGARMRGIALPPDFAIERARNIVMALHELFEDAEEAGFDRGYIDGVQGPSALRAPGEPANYRGEREED